MIYTTLKGYWAHKNDCAVVFDWKNVFKYVFEKFLYIYNKM